MATLITNKSLSDAASGLSNLEIETNSITSQPAGGASGHPNSDETAYSAWHKGDYSAFPTGHVGDLVRVFTNPTLVQSIHINPTQLGPIQAFSLFVTDVDNDAVFWLCYKRKINGPTTIIDRDTNLLLGGQVQCRLYFMADMYPMDTSFSNAINFTINCFALD